MRKTNLLVGVVLLGFAIPHPAHADTLDLSGSDSVWGTNVTLEATGGTAPYTFTLTGDGCSWTGTGTSRVLAGSKATTCYATVTDSAGTPDVATKTIVFAKKTPTLAITNSGALLSGSAITGVTILTSTKGTAPVTYGVADGTDSGCYVTGTKVFALTPVSAGTCTVTASQAANANFNAAARATATFTLSPGTQASLSISNTPLTRNGGGTFDLTTTGGSGTGNVSYVVTSGSCTLSGTYSQTVAPVVTGTCSFTATKAADSSYASASSAATTFTFVGAEQTAAAITNTVVKGTVGSTITVTATGGATNSTKTFTKSGTNCTIDATSGAMSATDATTCVITVTFTKSGYQTVSASKSFLFENQTDAISMTYADKALGVASPVTLTRHATGAVTYKVSGTGCSVDSSGQVTKSNRAGSCRVTATEAASTGYKAATAIATAKFT